MGPTDLISMYRRFLKRRNYSKHTVKNYINILGHFISWLQIPIEQVTNKQTDAYMDHLLRDRKKPKTINCHLGCIHAFYDYLIEDERMALINPVRKNYRLRLPRPLRYIAHPGGCLKSCLKNHYQIHIDCMLGQLYAKYPSNSGVLERPILQASNLIYVLPTILSQRCTSILFPTVP